MVSALLLVAAAQHVRRKRAMLAALGMAEPAGMALEAGTAGEVAEAAAAAKQARSSFSWLPRLWQRSSSRRRVGRSDAERSDELQEHLLSMPLVPAGGASSWASEDLGMMDGDELLGSAWPGLASASASAGVADAGVMSLMRYSSFADRLPGGAGQRGRQHGSWRAARPLVGPEGRRPAAPAPPGALRLRSVPVLSSSATSEQYILADPSSSLAPSSAAPASTAAPEPRAMAAASGGSSSTGTPRSPLPPSPFLVVQVDQGLLGQQVLEGCGAEGQLGQEQTEKAAGQGTLGQVVAAPAGASEAVAVPRAPSSPLPIVPMATSGLELPPGGAQANMDLHQHGPAHECLLGCCSCEQQPACLPSTTFYCNCPASTRSWDRPAVSHTTMHAAAGHPPEPLKHLLSDEGSSAGSAAQSSSEDTTDMACPTAAAAAAMSCPAQGSASSASPARQQGSPEITPAAHESGSDDGSLARLEISASRQITMMRPAMHITPTALPAALDSKLPATLPGMSAVHWTWLAVLLARCHRIGTVLPAVCAGACQQRGPVSIT